MSELTKPMKVEIPNEHVTVEVNLRHVGAHASIFHRDMEYTYFDKDLGFYVIVGHGKRTYVPLDNIISIEETRPTQDEREIHYGVPADAIFGDQF